MRAATRTTLAALLALAAAAPLAGQGGDTIPAPPPAAPHPETRAEPAFADSAAGMDAERAPAVSPLVAQDHWAVRAVSRAEALGLVRGWVPAQRSVPREVLRRALDEAAEAAAARGDAALAEVVRGWRARFAEEFRAVPLSGSGALSVRSLGGAVEGGFQEWTGRVEPAAGAFTFRRDPFPLADLSEGRGRVSAAFGVGRHLSLLAEGRADGGGVDFGRWEAAAGWGKWALSVGRMPVSYGVARGGGIVMSGSDLERLELRTERPLVLPGVLRHLGPVSAHTAVTRLDEARHLGDPYFWTMRAAFQPHPRFTVGINRATIFGGDSISTPVTLENVAKMFIGVLSYDFENQVVSVDGRFRVPSESVLPLVLYLEWGSEDASGAWWKVPGRVAGAVVPAVPGLPQLSVGAEVASFSDFCCGNPPWYFHAAQPGGWVLEGRPLGHPLGGEGREILGYAAAELFGARLRLEGRGWVRDRREEGYFTIQQAGNLYSRLRTGRSTGGSVEGAWRLLPRADLRARFWRDAGDDWAEQRLSADVSLFF